MPVKTITTTKRTFAVEVDADMLRSFLQVPLDATCRVTFDVPSGGDYSGMRLDVDKELPIRVEWTTTEETIE